MKNLITGISTVEYFVVSRVDNWSEFVNFLAELLKNLNTFHYNFKIFLAEAFRFFLQEIFHSTIFFKNYKTEINVNNGIIQGAI